MADIDEPRGGAPAPGHGGPPPPPPPPPGPQPAFDARAARAQAKAETARAKAMRPWYRKKRWWALGILVLVIGIAAASGGGDDDSPGTRTADRPSAATTGAPATDAPGADAAADTPATEAPADEGQEVFAIGETAHTSDFDVVVHAVEDPFTPANQFEPAPQAGHRFVAVEAQVTNTTDEQRTFSSLAGTEVTDHMDRSWDIALAGLDRPQLDGDVPPGGSRRGWMVFEVADDATDLHVRIKGSFTATGSLFALS